MLLFAAHVESDLMYVGSFVGEFGFVWSGTPMNFTSETLQARLERAQRAEELRRRVFLRERDRVAGRSAPRAGRAGPRPRGRRGPNGAFAVVTVQPGGSWRST